MAFDDDIRDLGSADTINAGAGDDLISGGDGNDTLNREDGSDTCTYTLGQGADTVQGGPGADTLNISGTTGHNVLDMMYDETVLTTFEDGTLTRVEAVTADPRGGTDTLSYIETSAAVTAGGGQELLNIRVLGITAATCATSVHITTEETGMRIDFGNPAGVRFSLIGVNAAAINATDFILAP